MELENKVIDAMPRKCLIVVYSYHHKNTQKIADALASVLNATVKTPEQVNLEELQEYSLIGFGAGIDSGRHYKPLLDFADVLPTVNKKLGFIFSTSAVMGEMKIKKDHALLRHKLESKGYAIIGDFSCLGFNTNVFLKYFGGINKGRPNSDDIKNAEQFALRLMSGEQN